MKKRKRSVVRRMLVILALIIASFLLFKAFWETEAPQLPKPRVRPLEATIKESDGQRIKEFNLAITAIAGEDGKEMLSFNRQVPGPEIRIDEEDTVRIIVYNNHTEPHTVHWHGIRVPYTMDGIPEVSQNPIMPGESFTYEFQVDQKGTFFYEDPYYRSNGLYGAFIVNPGSIGRHYQYVQEYFPSLVGEAKPYSRESTIILSEYGNTTIFNGRTSLSLLTVSENDMILLRLINAGEQSHSIHLHGHTMLVTHHDAVSLRSPEGQDTILIGPGERYDVLIKAQNPGVWMLSEENSRNGMKIVYEGFS